MKRVRCYVDGLNFYHGVTAACNDKWINLESLFTEILSQHLGEEVEVETILFFAYIKVGAPPRRQKHRVKSKDGEQLQRQRQYIEALKANCQRFQTRRGYFISESKNTRTQVFDSNGIRISKDVTIMTEKQTDVNLACHMVRDAYDPNQLKDYDIACLVSNDSDLVQALKFKKHLRQRTILITPRTTGGKSTNKLSSQVNGGDVIPSISSDLLKRNRLPGPPPRGDGWQRAVKSSPLPPSKPTLDGPPYAAHASAR